MDSTLQILEKVNALYSGAYTHLLTITLAILAFSGVILPLVIQMIQNRTFRTEQAALQGQITTKIDAAKNELKSDLGKSFDEEKKALEDIVKREVETLNARFTEQVSAAKGASFFLQGRTLQERQLFGPAARDFAYAADLLFKGADEMNSQRAMKQLRSCLSHLNKETFEETVDLEGYLATLLETLDKNNTNERFRDTITEITSDMQSAKRKSKPVPPSDTNKS